MSTRRRNQKPVLEIEETEKGDLLVKLSPEDVEHKQRLFRWCALHGLDVHKKRDEFSLMGRIQIPFWLRESLSEEFRLSEAVAA